jgi:hypothetical protein
LECFDELSMNGKNSKNVFVEGLRKDRQGDKETRRRGDEREIIDLWVSRRG